MTNDLIILLGTLLVIFFIIALLAFVFEFSKRQNRYYKEKELMNAHFAHTLVQSQLEIQEHTFKTISQEIHDNIGQMLTLVRINLNSIELNSDAKSGEKLNDAKVILKKAIQNLRDISKTLNTDTITQVGIAKAIQMELQLIEKVTEIKIAFESEGNEINIDPHVELILFRIVQESLHNIIKHAVASTINVVVSHLEKRLELKIKDDGIGFNTSLINEGAGLKNIESRSKLINAEVSVISSPNQGTEVCIKLNT